MYAAPVYNNTKGVSALQLIQIDLDRSGSYACPHLVNLNMDCNNYSRDSSGDVTWLLTSLYRGCNKVVTYKQQFIIVQYEDNSTCIPGNTI